MDRCSHKSPHGIEQLRLKTRFKSYLVKSVHWKSHGSQMAAIRDQRLNGIGAAQPPILAFPYEGL